jgi:1-acyl-sn-glycerol-3-phosphate acyltransferase
MKTQSDFGSDYGSMVLAALRVLGFFSLIIVMTPVQLIQGWRKPNEPFSISQLFHRCLLRLLGFRVRVHGEIAPTPRVVGEGSPVLFVANHASYLDIPVLSALIPAAFVAKAEVADWPLIGWLAKMQHTVFIERRSAHADRQRNDLRDRMAAGQSLMLFPEGTSSDGLTVLPFKSSLFSIVENAPADRPIMVQPVSVTCTEIDGLPITRAWRPFYAWYGDMTLIGHLWNVFKFGHFTVDVVFHPPIAASSFAGRKELAAYCQQQVARGIEQSLTGRGVAANTTLRLAGPAPAVLAGAKT